ncbi:MAG: hypothetical protein E7337_05680 [Clostridiales bacterium]|nr:hypothetical protein [Clostridiales bacterium]
MEFLFFLVILIFLIIPIALANLRDARKAHLAACAGIIHHDRYLRIFYFETTLSESAILERLSGDAASANTSFTVNPHASLIVFKNRGNRETFSFRIWESGGKSVIRLDSLNRSRRKSLLRYHLTPCIMQKINARPLPFT